MRDEPGDRTTAGSVAVYAGLAGRGDLGGTSEGEGATRSGNALQSAAGRVGDDGPPGPFELARPSGVTIVAETRAIETTRVNRCLGRHLPPPAVTFATRCLAAAVRTTP